MTGITPVALDSLPCAREIFRELDSDDAAAALYLIRGRSGTGKSTLLGAIRARLRARGIPHTDNPAHALRPPGTRADGHAGRIRIALIVDDAHTLGAGEFDLLCAAVEAGEFPVVIGLRPRPHDARLRALTDLVARRGRVVDLRALGATEIAPFARELGMMVPRGLALHIHRQTGGIHGGVVAALTAACATRLDAGMTAVDQAVASWARARLDDADPDLLDALVVAAIGAGLDTGELAEVLDLNPTAAQDLVDRARGSALVTDADLLLAPAVAPLRTLVGDRRFLTVARRLLHARLDAGLLRDHTALLLAESGVRDERLAEFLCAAAERAGDEAVRCYAAAAAAGADPEALAVRWADAAARAGDGDTALRLAEPALADPALSLADLAAAVRICAGVWTRRGLAERAAQLYTWLGPTRVGPDWAVAATVLYLSGDAQGAQMLSVNAAQWPPTEATARAALIANALFDSIGSPGVAGDATTPHGSARGAARRPSGTEYAAPPTAFRPPNGIAIQSPTKPTGADRNRPTDLEPPRQSDMLVAATPQPFGPASAPTGFTGEMRAIAPTTLAAQRFASPALAHRGAAVSAASALIQAAHSGPAPADHGGDRFLPCSPVSIAVLLCLSMGDPRRAADALRGTARDPQRLVLGAWVAMLGGDEHTAHTLMTEVELAQLDPRDRLLAHGVLVGLARRSGDHTALSLAWQQAAPLFDEVGPDLLALLPIGELWLAGIRLRDEARLTALVTGADELLRQLGQPPAWSNAFHWYAIQAAIAQESPEALLPHAHRLKTAAAAGDPQAAALADAGRTWVLVLRGQVARAQVEAAVARLAGLGLRWDAARLASEAALAAGDSATATALLKLARTLRAQARPPESPVRVAAPAAPQQRPEPITDTVLSEREREVAELVLLGLTYREIGARLYISAKTVEHHVARMRRRIGAGSRSELLSMLRAMGHGSLLV
ncbi:LuxR C-terminal-related transcriptional regulator [Nocardia sp. CDC153]|uniref:LuxR C-terminal-related transcriptional regulator n=1 Tax=Nocardia sp. CDC153 TaxID=3112167 RepID=UPI002DBDAD28|nr:LuxR C-terminal-related transcriptional regulator [Nocardia sp. CDC153]MEC3958538.1 LuxR C-terminal-related transcriptional regulator [Nocardia sp. CDC153]